MTEARRWSLLSVKQWLQLPVKQWLQPQGLCSGLIDHDPPRRPLTEAGGTYT
jgi:hypothetical protein